MFTIQRVVCLEARPWANYGECGGARERRNQGNYRRKKKLLQLIFVLYSPRVDQQSLNTRSCNGRLLARMLPSCLKILQLILTVFAL